VLWSIICDRFRQRIIFHLRLSDFAARFVIKHHSCGPSLDAKAFNSTGEGNGTFVDAVDFTCGF